MKIFSWTQFGIESIEDRIFVLSSLMHICPVWIVSIQNSIASTYIYYVSSYSWSDEVDIRWPCPADILPDDSSSQIQMTHVIILLKIMKFLQSTSVTTAGSSYCNAKIIHVSSSKSYDTITNVIHVYSSEVKFRTSWVFMWLNNTDDPYRWLFSSKWMIRHRRQA